MVTGAWAGDGSGAVRGPRVGRLLNWLLDNVGERDAIAPTKVVKLIRRVQVFN